MKIFGYEITKMKKVRKVIIDTQTYKSKIEIRLEGDGWGATDDLTFLAVVTSHFTNLSTEPLPQLTIEQKVHIIKIFYKDFCEFEII